METNFLLKLDVNWQDNWRLIDKIIPIKWSFFFESSEIFGVNSGLDGIKAVKIL